MRKVLKKIIYNFCFKIQNIQDRKFYSKKNSFSIIAPCYNSELYIDQFFESISGQKYDNSKIELIFIDDCSTDNTIDKLNKIKNNNPSININIVSLDENKGQANARNIGLENVNNDYILFIDSDDFVEKNYIKEINKCINKYPNVTIFSASIIYFLEKNNKKENSHMLNYRFKGLKTECTRDTLVESNYFQLAVSHACLKTVLIKRNNLKFKELKPQFEDSYFIFEYMLLNNSFEITYINSTKYFYRKRCANNSTIDKSVYNPSRYTSLYKDGYIDIFEKYNCKLGYVPEFLQCAILYIISWDFKVIENKTFKLSHSDQKEWNENIVHLKKYISTDASIKMEKWYQNIPFFK